MVYILLWNGNVWKVTGSLLEDRNVSNEDLDLKPVVYRTKCNNDEGSCLVTKKVSIRKSSRNLLNIASRGHELDQQQIIEKSNQEHTSSIVPFRRRQRRMFKTIKVSKEEKPEDEEDDEFGGFCVYNHHIAIFGHDGIKFADLHPDPA